MEKPRVEDAKNNTEFLEAVETTPIEGPKAALEAVTNPKTDIREQPEEKIKKETSLLGKITGFFEKRKLDNFKAKTSKRLNAFLSKGYKLPAGGEEKLWADAKDDGYEGNLGVDQANNIIRYIPTADISYSGNTNSSGGPTAGN